ncbi:hypothetical protein EHW99_0008 [Erwinia amylovora]|uniref:Uncharacterized protein n=3 Tax=Erwinia amylovora TaxID=552 RepID=A0A830ZYS6_ERWAM|nr:hypothetical protein EaACW_0009 [Erwinia amylovora ACW56400]QJQ52716.1 hypothetical protein EHX00_0008 [Erwinia amylovora]CBA18950.1 hypothetical protein predicted by Glimmer/Critica [Erwinia amylovora CFBP1430]CBX78830.1 hypothetical protein predicted by Glimmer/Critica [Erwinia amylovora ATCC BAA-2158]CCO76856.1 hypothetical protein BN432_0008 [Erwinia amylovora Ea356]CCO80632.1 hypothetical protein BN433_0010 [Erwinia amylovora Ea266]CCO84448.1 hypothetical protein BN434_0009 [Erwinia a
MIVTAVGPRLLLAFDRQLSSDLYLSLDGSMQ